MKIICFLFGHRYKLFMKITKSIDEVHCSRCRKQFSLHHDLKTILPLDKELIDFHNDIILKRSL